MGCKVIVKNQLEVAANPAVVGIVHAFESGPVRAGSDPRCLCHINTDELAAHQLELFQNDTDAKRWHLRSLAPIPTTYVNDTLLDQTVELQSGDEIRVGHWTFSFHRDYAPSATLRRSDCSARIAQILLATLIAVELALVSWLPRHLHKARLWENQMLRERTLQLLDQQRSHSRSPDADDNQQLQLAAKDMVSRELDVIAAYLRNYQDQLQPEHWRRIESELQQFQLILHQLDQQSIFPPLPVIDLDAAVSNVVGQAEESL